MFIKHGFYTNWFNCLVWQIRQNPVTGSHMWRYSVRESPNPGFKCFGTIAFYLFFGLPYANLLQSIGHLSASGCGWNRTRFSPSFTKFSSHPHPPLPCTSSVQCGGSSARQANHKRLPPLPDSAMQRPYDGTR